MENQNAYLEQLLKNKSTNKHEGDTSSLANPLLSRFSYLTKRSHTADIIANNYRNRITCSIIRSS